MRLARHIVACLLSEAVPPEAESALRRFKSFYGFNEAGQVRVCGWCPDKPEADRVAKEMGLEVSHGICPTHADEQQVELAAFKRERLAHQSRGGGLPRPQVG